MGCAYSHLSFWSDRVACIEQHVHNHALELVSVSVQLWKRSKLLYQLNFGNAIQCLQRFRHQLIKIAFGRLKFQFVSQSAQSLNKLINPACSFADALQSILPKSWIIKMDRQILQHEVQSRSCIFQVMNKER